MRNPAVMSEGDLEYLGQGVCNLPSTVGVYHPAASAPWPTIRLSDEFVAFEKSLRESRKCESARTDEKVHVITPDAPPWWSTAVGRLVELMSLSPGWDSHGARSIDLQIAGAAGTFLLLLPVKELPHPSIVPTVSGGVQLEWHDCGVDLEVEFLSPTRFFIDYENSKLRQEWSGEASFSDLEALTSLFLPLSRGS